MKKSNSVVEKVLRGDTSGGVGQPVCKKKQDVVKGNGCYCVRSLKYLCKNEMTLAKIHVAKREMIKEKSRSGKENPFMKRILMEKTIPAMRVSQPHPVRGLGI